MWTFWKHLDSIALIDEFQWREYLKFGVCVLEKRRKVPSSVFGDKMRAIMVWQGSICG
jgi:hypothetical protein